MASGPVLALLLAILSLGAVLLAWGLVALAQWGRLWRRGRRASTDRPAGVASLRGTCKPTSQEQVVTSPLSGHKAVWYAVTLQRDEGRPVRPQWSAVGRESEVESFYLDADGDSVRVDPSAATVDLAPGATLDFEATPDALEDLRSNLESMAVEATDGALQVGSWELQAGEYYRLVERRIASGDSISVTGRLEATPTGADAASARIEGPADSSRRRRLLGIPFVIADAGGDSGPKRLRNRTLVGLVFGLPLTLLAIVFMFPPGT
jgi:hypothetical protein